MTDIRITNSTKDIVVSDYANPVQQVETITMPVVGEAQEETITVPAVAEAQIEVVTIPATAGATQADFVVISNAAGETAAVWLDIDDDGTAPTGAKYTGADYQIEVDIATGAANTVNATAFKDAIELVVAFTGISLTDNADGTITVTQSSVGVVAEADPENADGSGVGSITSSTSNLGVTGMVQADYVMLYNQAGSSFAVWFDVDADGTEPTGAKYVASDYQVEVNVATGDSSADNATAMATALGLEVNYADVTITDNLDGTVTLTQDNTGACSNADPENANDSGIGAITVSLDNDGVTGAAQGDYILLTNKSNDETIAAWIDIDEDGTAPTGALYVASDYQVIVPLITGGSAADSGTAFYDAIIAEDDWANFVSVVDNEDGTVTVTQRIGGVVDVAVPKNTGDTGVGSITSSTGTLGTSGSLVIADYLPKAGLRLVQDVNAGTVCLIAQNQDRIPKGGNYRNIKYSDVTSPSTVSLTALVAQIISWKDA